jgi:hypothetical protein
MAGGIGIGSIESVQGLLGLIAPVARQEGYMLNLLMPNNVPDLETLVSLYVTDMITKDAYIKYGGQLGFAEGWLNHLANLLRKKPEIADLITLYRRGKIQGQRFFELMQAQGVNADLVPLFVSAYEYFPPPPDLIRFAIREVYTPTTRKAYGMDEDLPSEYIKEAYKAGLPAEQAKNYWAAHWQLPSTQQMIEMFHRGIITLDQLKDGLKALDIMPFWREKIIQMSYNVITRVDARRMYDLGVLNEEGLHKAYTDMGYSPDNADKLVLFTKRLSHVEAHNLTRQQVLEAYVRDIITKDKLIEYLKELHVDEEATAFWIAQADWMKMKAGLDAHLQTLKNEYLAGSMTIDQVRQHLTEDGVPESLITSTVNLIQNTKNKSQKLPSKADLDDWFMNSIIEEDQYNTKMIAIGYSADNVHLYLHSLTMKREGTHRHFLTIAQYVKWFKKGIMTTDQLLSTLKSAGYSDEDIQREME